MTQDDPRPLSRLLLLANDLWSPEAAERDPDSMMRLIRADPTLRYLERNLRWSDCSVAAE